MDASDENFEFTLPPSPSIDHKDDFETSISTNKLIRSITNSLSVYLEGELKN